MFVKCGRCGYLTPDSSALCKHCGAVAMQSSVEDEAPGASAPAPDAGPAPTWPSPTVPIPTHAPPSFAPPPPPPPPGPVASMFPEPGARPSRHPLPTWSFVTGAVVVVIVALVAVLATRGGDGSGAQQLRAANAHGARVDRDVAALDASLLSVADLGRDWSVFDHGGIGREDLRWTDDCDHAPGLESTAQLGRLVDFSYAVNPETGAESGHVGMKVRQYASVDDAAGQLAARNDAAFAPCITLFDVTSLVDGRGVAIVPGPVTRVAIPGVDAVAYRDTLDYTFFGKPQKMFETHIYLAQGRFFASMTVERCCGDYAQPLVEDLVRTVAQRLAVHAPTS